ncbi:DUF805 domain-containing protein [Brevundimonas pishanensis]|uniref:DUF805 domain-containing protein n=1 Tax=Brevundimonas pishanensis TaxID=2896315 RepID=UPI001FA75ADA|nr:DUF805 domain-containing protein [Brevundimonas pishanensis]
MSAELTLSQKLFSFNGRMRRRDYWLTTIGLQVVVFFGFDIAMGAIFGPDFSLFTSGGAGVRNRLSHTPSVAIEAVLNFCLVWPACALAAKRAHDRDKNAKPIIALVIMTFVLAWGRSLFGLGYIVGSGAFWTFYLLGMAISFYLFVVVGILDGTRGPNRYGPSPKGLEFAKVSE